MKMYSTHSNTMICSCTHDGSIKLLVGVVCCHLENNEPNSVPKYCNTL